LIKISNELWLDLKIDIVSITTGEIIKIDDTCNSSTRKKIRVTFPDGTTIQHNKVLDTLIEVIKYANPRLVRELKIINCTSNLVLKHYEINPRYKRATKQLDDTYYVNTCSDTQVKYMQIIEISDKLKLNLIVDLV
jgi:hypothetical protein